MVLIHIEGYVLDGELHSRQRGAFKSLSLFALDSIQILTRSVIPLASAGAAWRLSTAVAFSQP
jgi:hypothetical protein